MWLLLVAGCGQQGDTDPSALQDQLPPELQLAANDERLAPDSLLAQIDAFTVRMNEVNLDASQKKALHRLRIGAFQTLGQMDSAVFYTQALLRLAEQEKDTMAVVTALATLASAALEVRQLDKLGVWLNPAITYLQQKPVMAETGWVYLLKGTITHHRQEFEDAQRWLLDAYGVFMALEDFLGISKVCIILGNNYQQLNSPQDALFHFLRALEYGRKAGKNELLVDAWNNLGVYYRRSQPDSAIYYYQQIIDLVRPLEYDIGLVRAQFNMANILMDKGRTAQAMEAFIQIRDSCQAKGIHTGVIFARSGISAVLGKQGDIDGALRELEWTIALADSLGVTVVLTPLSKELVSQYKARGEYKKALDVLQRLKVQADSIREQRKQESIRELEDFFEVEKKALENQNLRKERESKEKLILFRQILLYLSIFIVLGLGYFLWNTARLNRQLANAHGVLMEKYKKEREAVQELSLPIPNPAIATRDLEVFERVQHYFETEHPYLDPRLKVEDIASALGITARTISAALKVQQYNNISQFINRYRVERVKRLLADPKFESYKIDAIATEAGFGNKQTFYSTFEHFTGVTPGYYRDHILVGYEEE